MPAGFDREGGRGWQGGEEVVEGIGGEAYEVVVEFEGLSPCE